MTFSATNAAAGGAAVSTGYDFSSFFPVSAGAHAPALVFSPGSTFFLTSVSNRVILRQTTTLTVAQSWLCGSEPTSLSHLAFSHDTAYVLAVSLKLGLCWVFGLGDGEEPLAVIRAGPEGITRAEFGVASHRREVLVWSDHGLRMTIHDLTSGETNVITNPKQSAGVTTHCFTPSGSDLIMLETHNGKTLVGVYNTTQRGPYQLLHHFALPFHPPSFSLSPSATKPHLLLPHPAMSAAGYKFDVYNPIGIHIGSFGWEHESFEVENGSKRVDPGSSIRCVQWGPGGKWVGVGGSDGKVRIVESDGWRCIKTIGYENKGRRSPHIAACKEPEGWYKDTRGQGIVQFGPVSTSMPTSSLKRDLASPHAKSGVSHVQWSQDGTLFLSRLDSQPLILNIHSFLPTTEHPTPIIDRIAQVEFSAAIKAVQWSSDPKRSKRLAVVTGGGSVYFWDGGEEWESGAVAEAIGIPGGASFSASDLIWSPDGQALAVIGKDQYCMVYDSLDEDAIPSSPSIGEESFASA